MGASLQPKAPSRQSVRVPCKAFPYKARLCPSTAPTTKSLTPWPALWPLTLAMKSQKPCSERWPLTAPSAQPRAALPTQPANGQRLVASLCASPTARCRPLYEGAAAAQATRPARATAPLQPSQLRLQARNVSANPSEEIAALASTMARRYSRRLRAGLCKPQAEQLRVSVRRPLRRPLAKPKRARPPQSSAVKLWAQAGAAATFTNVSATQLDPAAALG